MEIDPKRAFQRLEKRYFEPGDLGTGPAHDGWRHWDVHLQRSPLAGDCRVMGPGALKWCCWDHGHAFGQFAEKLRKALKGGCSPQFGSAVRNTCRMLRGVAVAKAGGEDGHPLIGGSAVSPDWQIRAIQGLKVTNSSCILAISTIRSSGKQRSLILPRAPLRSEHYSWAAKRASSRLAEKNHDDCFDAVVIRGGNRCIGWQTLF